MNNVYKGKDTVINFYIPPVNNIPPDRLASEILKNIKSDNNQNLLGFSNLEIFKKELLSKLGNKKIKAISFDKKLQNKIVECITNFQTKFKKELPLKYKPLRFYIFPWFPDAKENKDFEGVMAVATYFTVVHIYINLKNFSEKSLEKTLAHEMNHLYFYQANDKHVLNIKESIIAEGLAENFRESFVGGKIAPWSKALKEKEILEIIPKLRNIYESLDRKIYVEVFYGRGKLKKWTGYSVGYFLVKKFIKENPKFNWKQIMNLKVEKFLKSKI